MSKFSNIVNSFKAGKLSKKLTHRQDIEDIKNGCEELTNFIVTPSGGVKRRYGTFDVTNTGTLSSTGSLYNIKYSKEYSYIVLIENTEANIFETVTRSVGESSKFIRVFTSNGVEKKVHTIKTIMAGVDTWYDTSYTAFDPSVETCFSKLPHSGWQVAQLSRKTIFTHTGGKKMPFVIDLQLSTGSPILVVYPWCFDKDLFTRNALDELYGGITTPFGGVTVPVGSINTNTVSRATLASITGAYTSGKLTENTGASDKKMFRTIVFEKFPSLSNLNDYVGCSIVLRNGSGQDGTYIVVKVDPYYSYPDVKFWVICTCESTAGALVTTQWAFSQWGGVSGFPRSVTTYKGKVVFGGSINRPSTFWATSINANNPNSFQNLMPFKLAQDSASDFSGFQYYGTSVTDLGLSATFNEASSGDIKWVRGRTLLHFGTNVGEHQISFINNVFAISNMESKKVTSYSSSSTQVVEGNQKIFYVANNGTTIRYLSTNDKYSESIDISLSTLNGEYREIQKLEWCEEPSLLLFKTSDNTLHGITVNEQSGVSAYCDFEFPFDVIDFTVIDKTMYGNDGNTLYILAKMGATYTLVALPFDNVDRTAINTTYADYQYHYVDMARIITGTVNGSNTYTFSKFANKTVGIYNNETYTEVLADGSGNIVNANETIGSSILIGIPYESRLTTSQIEEGSKYGKATGAIKRIDRATLFLTKSGTCKIGANNGTLYTVEKTTSTFDDYSPVMEFSSNPDYHIKCVVKSTNGQALNISSIAFRGVTYEGE